jgi:urea transport system permease protein
MTGSIIRHLGRLSLVAVLACLVLAGNAWAQDSDSSDDAEDQSQAEAALAPATDFVSAIKALDADDYDAKLAAVRFLGKLGDPRALPVLQAMQDGRLMATAEGRLVYADPAGTYIDALTGAGVPGLSADALSEVIVNNRLRGTLQGVIGEFSLFSPDVEIRRQAAAAIADQPTPDSAALLRQVLAKEADPATRKAMAGALAELDLQDPDPARRLAAIKALGSSDDPNVQGQLQRLLDKETVPELRRAAEAAEAGIQSRLRLIGIAVELFEGVSLGSILLLAAIGLSITFGVMGVINMAHGEMIMLGAYSTFATQELFRAFLPPDWIGGYLVAALPIAFLVSGFFGVLLERCVIRFLYGRPLETLLATWGISLILQQLVRSLFGADNRAVANPDWMTGGVALMGGFILTWNRLAIIVFCLLVLAVLAALLRFSRFGLSLRAVSQNRPMAAAMGIRTGRIDALTFGLGSGIAGIAGVALSQIGNVSPNLGQTYIVDSFMVVVFGGVGSLWGTLLGAFSLGIVNKLLEPFAGAILGKIFVLVFVILFIQRRPRGLFALKGRSAEG